LREQPTVSKRGDGLFLNVEAFDHELAIRCITVSTLAEKAGVPEETISRVRHGTRRLRESTLRRLVDALATFPVLAGAELLVGVAPESARKNNGASAKKNGPRLTSRAVEGGRHARGRTSERS